MINTVIIKNINLYDNYNLTFDIKHLDSRILRISKPEHDALHLNDSLRIIKGEGMPYYKSSTEKGDLFIRFNLVIPKSIEKNHLLKLKEIFNLTSENKLFDKPDINYYLENVSDSDLEETESSSESDESDESDESESVSSISSDSSEEIKFKSKRSLKK